MKIIDLIQCFNIGFLQSLSEIAIENRIFVSNIILGGVIHNNQFRLLQCLNIKFGWITRKKLYKSPSHKPVPQI